MHCSAIFNGKQLDLNYLNYDPMLYQGIVIKKTDTGEHNQLVTLYTKEFGKVTAVAKSLKKNTSKQAGHLDILNLANFIFVSGKNYPIITSAQSLETFNGIKASLAKSFLAFFFLEALDNLVYENDKDPALWDFLNSKLEELDKLETLNGNFNLFFSGLKDGLSGVLGYPGNFGEKDFNVFLSSLSSRVFYSLNLVSDII